MVSKKVLIISYFFPPCNLTASQRANNWAKELNKFGYFPIVVTRKWDHKIESISDLGKPSINQKIAVINNEKFKIIYAPYKSSLKDMIFIKYPYLNFLRKLLTLAELIFQNFTIKILPYSNIFEIARQTIIKEDIKKLIITGNPFPCFHFGFLLKNEFKNLKWIADYRDDWTTTELTSKKSGLSKTLFMLDQRSEKKWLSKASLVTSVSNYYVKKISNFTKVEGIELLNGYDDEVEKLTNQAIETNQFIITYNGSLYNSQKIEPILEIIKELIKEYENKQEIILKFPGLAFNPAQENRVRKVFSGLENKIYITNRIERKKVLKIQQESQLLLMIAHENIKGIPSSKLYEYIGLRKPILIYPSDKDIIENTLRKTKLGITGNSRSEIKTKLKNLIDEFIKTKKTKITGDENEIKSLSRRKQTQKLAEILDNL